MIALKEKSTSKQRLTREKAHYQFIPELNDLPYLKAQFKNQCFSRHVHEGYCIGVIEEGAQRFYRSGGNHIASENCIILVNADQVHDGQTATDNGWRYKAVYPTGDMFNEVIREYTQQRANWTWPCKNPDHHAQNQIHPVGQRTHWDSTIWMRGPRPR